MIRTVTKNKVKPDTILKNFWKDNARFADLFNAILFNGENVIKPEELEEAEGEFMESPFVKKILGVGNVCERAAVLHSGGRLCFPKCAVNGMTVAAAYSEREIQFEKGTTIREIGISR